MKYGKSLLAASIAITALAFILISITALVNSGARSPIVKSRILMGTTVEITVSGPVAPREADAAIEAAFDEIKRIEAKFSVYDNRSEISRLNNLASAEPVKVDEEVLNVIDSALGFGRLTGGAFDITVRPLAGLWKAAGEKGAVPSEEEMRAALDRVGWEHVAVDRARGEIRFLKPGMGIDLGGIAKGYAVDRAIGKLKGRGVKNAIVNAGGDTYCLGEKRPGIKWKVGIRHPRAKESLLGWLEVSDMAVVTSGDYERFVTIAGRRFSHIVNPKTGMTVDSIPASVTIIAPDTMAADALATAVMVLGPEKGLELVKGLNGFDVVIIIEEKGGGLKLETSIGARKKYGFKEI